MDRYASLGKTCAYVPVTDLRYGDSLVQVTGGEPWIGAATVRSVRAGFTDEWIIRTRAGEYSVRAIVPGEPPRFWVRAPRP